MLPTRVWTELCWTDLAAADMASAIAVLPVAAVEQHGPHLPLGTDGYIMEGYLAQALPLLPAELPVLVLPMQSCGASQEHGEFPGTLSLAATHALAAWTDLATSVARAGCRKLVLLNAHGGNAPLLDILAQDLRARLGLFVVKAAWSRFGYPDGLFSEAELLHGIHAGAIETALMLHFRPDLVRPFKGPAAAPASLAMARDFAWLRAGRPAGFGWMAQDLAADGVMGDPGAATAAKGAACAAHGAAAFVALLRDVAAFDLARLTGAPDAPTP
jgi:creatinine amidohydrolase